MRLTVRPLCSHCYNCLVSSMVDLRKRSQQAQGARCKLTEDSQQGYKVDERLQNELAVRFHVSLQCVSCELKFFTGMALSCNTSSVISQHALRTCLLNPMRVSLLFILLLWLQHKKTSIKDKHTKKLSNSLLDIHSHTSLFPALKRRKLSFEFHSNTRLL